MIKTGKILFLCCAINAVSMTEITGTFELMPSEDYTEDNSLITSYGTFELLQEQEQAERSPASERESPKTFPDGVNEMTGTFY